MCLGKVFGLFHLGRQVKAALEIFAELRHREVYLAKVARCAVIKPHYNAPPILRQYCESSSTIVLNDCVWA